MLAAKACVTEVDSKGCTPLHLSAWNGHAAICDTLLHCASDKSIVNVQVGKRASPAGGLCLNPVGCWSRPAPPLGTR